MMRPAAVASSIISICILIRATWPETNLLVAGVLVGGVRGDWKGEPRSHKLPNRFFLLIPCVASDACCLLRIV